ncbi:hypothetical protein [Natrinema caseinilyticum]|uniref:hypothetical protein n=1 Tax=Natrinema caseinilyticum TaxID=2961570 RepID=UPI0020C58EC7|nr:hypothetical protein [Natrinema caseinilyticum]
MSYQQPPRQQEGQATYQQVGRQQPQQQTGQQQPQQQTGQQQPQQQTGQQYQQQPQSFDQAVPQQVSQAIYQLEQLESDAEWAHGRAMEAGDRFTSGKLADLSQAIHLQKTLLLRQSDMAQTFGQCTQQALQQSSQELQQSQIPGVQQVIQKAQQLSQTISQASQQVAQQSQSQQMGGQQMGGQTSSPHVRGQSF